MLNRKIVAALVLLGTNACGGNSSPSAPTAPVNVNVAGAWVGTMSYTQNNADGAAAQFNQAVSLSLTQSDTTVGGTWTSTNGPARSGTVGGSVTVSAFSGSFTYNATSTNGNPCTGTLAVSGAVSGNSLTWTSPSVVENCGNAPTQLTFSAVRQ
jgi:hypothetical protein